MTPKPKLALVPEAPSQRTQTANNLHVERSRLVGREKEVEAVARLLGGTARSQGSTGRQDGGPQVRLLTLVGPGGVGKTSLAMGVADRLVEVFEDGAYFVDLSSIVEADLVLSTIATALKVRVDPSAPLLSTLKTHIQNKRILLVLDNFEQVIQAGATLSEILAACPNVALLVTSRIPLKLRNEQVFAVSPLTMPARNVQTLKRSNVQSLLQYGAIELFVRRAGTREADFELTEDNAGAVVEICRRVDGLPLAIELVATHARLLSPQSILVRLTRPLLLLAGAPQDAPARHRTMRDTIEWSYNLLNSEEQRLFSRLSVFVGGFEVRAAEAVCNDGGDISLEEDNPYSIMVLKHTEALVDKSMVRRLEENEDGDRRLAMLETVREYALEHLRASGESEVIARRHTEYFLNLAEEAEPHLIGPDQRAWVARLEVEHNNLRSVLSRCLPSEGQSTSHGSPGSQRNVDTQAALAGLRLAGALGQFWERGNLSEGRRWLQSALEVTRRLDESNVGQIESRSPSRSQGFRSFANARVKALNAAGNLARLAGDFPAARQALHAGLEISRRLDERQEVAATLENLGAMMLMQGDFAEARLNLNESLAIRRDLGFELEAAYSLTHLGNIAMLEENYAEARRLHEEALTIKRRAGDKEGIGHSLHSLATIARRQGNYDEARRLDEETLAIARELGNRRGIAYALRDLGHVAYERADYPTALGSFIESLTVFRDLEDVIPTIECLLGLGRVASRIGKPDHAVHLFGKAYAMLESTEGQLDPADSAAYERDLAALRARLGEQSFASAWEEGHAMTLDQALQLAAQEYGNREPAIGESPAPDSPLPTPGKRGSGGLTAREYEIASLVIQGLSNADIARDLILSERTVEMHVLNALHKLGLTRRTQLTAWALEHGPSTREEYS